MKLKSESRDDKIKQMVERIVASGSYSTNVYGRPVPAVDPHKLAELLVEMAEE